MKAVIVADIHANLMAVDKLGRFLDVSDFDTVFCLGDMIGYGDEPNEVITFLKSINARCVSGNHEYLFFQGEVGERYNFPHTRKVISDASVEYLSDLPREIMLKQYNAIFSHGVPFTDFEYLYANSDFSILDKIVQQKIFLGHTHYPMLASYYDKTILNPGSLGMPRDGIGLSSILICDLETENYQFVRL